jgi:hypothetical protein
MLARFLGKKILDKVLRGVDFTVSTVYVSLHNGDPGATGANEITGGSYARQQVNHAGWNAAADAIEGSECTTISDLTFTNLTANTITHVGFWDAVSGGNFLMGGETIQDSVIGGGGNFILTAGFLSGKMI